MVRNRIDRLDRDTISRALDELERRIRRDFANGDIGAVETTDYTFIVKHYLDNSRKFRFLASLMTPSVTRSFALPDADTTLVGTDTTQTLSNKTHVTPTIASFANATHNHQNAAGGGQLAGASVLSEGTTGTGAFVRATSPTLTTPALGTPSALVATNVTGTAAGLTAGTVTTNANLTGPITSTGNATAVAAQTGTGSTFMMQAAPQPTSVNITDSILDLNSARLQMFAIEITNTAGTIQHRIYGERGTQTASAYVGKVNGASASYSNTPTVGAGTGFTAGLGIDGASAARVLLDVATQSDAKHGLMCIIEQNTTATAGVLATPRTVSSDVNGSTRNRIAIGFVTAAGGAHNISTANIGAGTILRVRVMGVIE